jgi:glycosyltransferase involved in cell wall biosynthesis
MRIAQVAPLHERVPPARYGGTERVVAYLGDEEIVDAVKRIDTISRAECRKHVEERFTVERMVDDYEAVYAELLDTKAAG